MDARLVSDRVLYRLEVAAAEADQRYVLVVAVWLFLFVVECVVNWVTCYSATTSISTLRECVALIYRNDRRQRGRSSQQEFRFISNAMALHCCSSSVLQWMTLLCSMVLSRPLQAAVYRASLKMKTTWGPSRESTLNRCNRRSCRRSVWPAQGPLETNIQRVQPRAFRS